MLGDPGDPRYLMYPFAAAVFAIIGIVVALKSQARTVLRVMWFGLAFLAALVALYLFYFFTEIAFILPATFILFAAAGYGIVVANRAMLEARTSRSARPRAISAVIAGVVALDLMLAVSMVAETAGRVSATPSQSKMVPVAARDPFATAAGCDRGQQHLASVSGTVSGEAEDRTDRSERIRSGRSIHRLSSRAPVREKSRRMVRAGAAGSVCRSAHR